MTNSNLHLSRCSIFLVSGSESEDSRCLVSHLFDVSCHEPPNKDESAHEKIKIDWGSGIAGRVAQTGEPIILSDAYQVISLCVFANYILCFKL